MREIKFRGYCDRDSEWRYGYYITDGKIHEINTLLRDDKTLYGSQIDIESLGQYTGLKDKNGVEIYEGDIVRFQHIDDYGYMTNVFQNESHVGVVKWGGFYPAFDIFNINDNSTFGFDCNIFSMESDVVIEIIGNIYENPELLKEKK